MSQSPGVNITPLGNNEMPVGGEDLYHSESSRDESPFSSSKPSKKSAITQQQRYNKRQRANPQQFNYLIKEFEINRSPSSKRREEISKAIDMTERSVQIWFQNKRAKAKKSTGNNEMSSKDVHNGMPRFYQRAYQMGAYDDEEQAQGTSLNRSRLYIPCYSLRIGSWVRVSKTASPSDELSVYYTPLTEIFSYVISTSKIGFRIDIPFSIVDKVEVSKGGQEEGESGYDHLYNDMNDSEGGFPNSKDNRDNKNYNNSNDNGSLYLFLHDKPNFLVKPSQSTVWSENWDFSEGKQASHIPLHRLTGPYEQLLDSLQRLKEYQFNAYQLRNAKNYNNSSSAIDNNSLYDMEDAELVTEDQPLQIFEVPPLPLPPPPQSLAPAPPERDMTQSTPASFLGIRHEDISGLTSEDALSDTNLVSSVATDNEVSNRQLKQQHMHNLSNTSSSASDWITSEFLESTTTTSPMNSPFPSSFEIGSFDDFSNELPNHDSVCILSPTVGEDNGGEEGKYLATGNEIYHQYGEDTANLLLQQMTMEDAISLGFSGQEDNGDNQSHFV